MATIGKTIGHDFSKGPLEIRQNGKTTYREESNGSWVKMTYNEEDKLIYREKSNGHWSRYTYDNHNRIIYTEYSDGRWTHYIRDKKGIAIRRIESVKKWKRTEYSSSKTTTSIYLDGSWCKCNFTERIKQTGISSWETVNCDVDFIRLKNENGVVVEEIKETIIDGKLYKLIEVV